MDLFRKKSALSYIEEAGATDQTTKLKKSLGAMDLTILGVGAIV